MDELRSRLAHAVAWMTALFGSLSFNDWGILIGILCSIFTMGVNWYYARKKALIEIAAVQVK